MSSFSPSSASNITLSRYRLNTLEEWEGVCDNVGIPNSCFCDSIQFFYCLQQTFLKSLTLHYSQHSFYIHRIGDLFEINEKKKKKNQEVSFLDFPSLFFHLCERANMINRPSFIPEPSLILSNTLSSHCFILCQIILANTLFECGSKAIGL